MVEAIKVKFILEKPKTNIFFLIYAKYPIVETNDFLSIYIFTPEPDPESPNNNRRCKWSINALDFSKSDFIYGIDDLQCVMLTFHHLAHEIGEWENVKGMRCDYYFV